jgi:hypothetical protein
MKLCSCMKFDNIDAIDHMDEIKIYGWNWLYTNKLYHMDEFFL